MAHAIASRRSSRARCVSFGALPPTWSGGSVGFTIQPFAPGLCPDQRVPLGLFPTGTKPSITIALRMVQGAIVSIMAINSSAARWSQARRV
jgi:hypothetical protein